MNGREKSDPALRAMKPANNVGRPTAEWVEQRAGAEGNAGQPHTCRAQNRKSVPQGLERVRQAALPSITQGGSRMPESGTFGSVRGVPGNGHPYRDQLPPQRGVARSCSMSARVAAVGGRKKSEICGYVRGPRWRTPEHAG
jgi:hypothetical protein